MNLIASLKHTHQDHEHITFWRPNERGYTPVLSSAGQYEPEKSLHLNNGDSTIAVPVEAVFALAVGTPYFKPGAQFYDEAGPVVDNTRANWNALIKASVTAGRPAGAKPKPEVFKGTRRSFQAP